MKQITGNDIRAKRMGAGISGAVLCLKTGIGRTRLSDIERGYVTATEEEILNIQTALNELAQVQQKTSRNRHCERMAGGGGWRPMKPYSLDDCWEQVKLKYNLLGRAVPRRWLAAYSAVLTLFRWGARP